QGRDQVRVGREVGPRHGRRAGLGGGVELLEPADVVAAGDGIRGELAGERAVLVCLTGHVTNHDGSTAIDTTSGMTPIDSCVSSLLMAAFDSAIHSWALMSMAR